MCRTGNNRSGIGVTGKSGKITLPQGIEPKIGNAIRRGALVLLKLTTRALISIYRSGERPLTSVQQELVAIRTLLGDINSTGEFYVGERETERERKRSVSTSRHDGRKERNERGSRKVKDTFIRIIIFSARRVLRKRRERPSSTDGTCLFAPVQLQFLPFYCLFSYLLSHSLSLPLSNRNLYYNAAIKANVCVSDTSNHYLLTSKEAFV